MRFLSTLRENVTRAIEDFDSIKQAIIDKDVEVPDDTPTSEYSEKIKEIETGVVPSGIIRIEKNGEYDVTQYATAIVSFQQLANALIGTPSTGYRINSGLYPDYGRIKSYAFYHDGWLLEIDFGYLTNLSSIGNYAFSGCSALQHFYLSTANTSVDCHLGGHVFEGCRDFQFTELNLTIVTEIGEKCFAGSRVNKIILSRLSKVSTDAFAEAGNLSDIYYTGTQAEWDNISNISNAGIDPNVTVHYEYNQAASGS